ncbi:MAG TPA: ferritin family protein [Methanocella sp.]|uniref:ferritin family protein n=1 Tax=Methanocella sp. TaxID=2052833 RepID=UPI002B96F713|nr:ferritin family protein [Methanocella sp.]HTY91615.1 ferritin family protein [Methanocella sp.]
MPEFANPFAGMNAPRKLTRDELVRAIRFDIAAEYEAIQLYRQLADSIDDKVAKAVLEDIAEEEAVHAGEFLRLLKYLQPDEEKSYEKGYKEVEDMMKKLKKK